MFGRKRVNTTAPEVSTPYYYVDREETINFDDLCRTGGVPVMFTIATMAIIFFAAQYFYQLELDIMVKDQAGKKEEDQEKEKEKIILIKSLTDGGKLEEAFVAPFVPSNMETLASAIFFIWFVVTASFGVSRVYEGRWINENSMEQYPFNILSFLVGCPGLDPYDVAYTKTWKEAPPTENDEDPFNSFLGMFFSRWGIAAMVTLIAAILPFVRTIAKRTFLLLVSLSILGLSIYEMYFAGKTKAAGLLAFEFFFSHHMSFGLAWLCFGFYQIYRARHGWVYISTPTNSATHPTTKDEVTADMNAARHAAHRLFGRVVAVPTLSMHLLMALVMASRNPANQAAPMRENYFIVVFTSVNFAIWGVSFAVSAREKQAEIDEIKKDAEGRDLSDELKEQLHEASKLRDFCRNKHMVMMFQTWTTSLAGSGSVRIAIWFLWTISKFFEPELRKKIDRGYCIDSAYEEGDTPDIGDSSTCVAPVFLNILFMGLIIEWVNWAFLRTDTVQDARVKFKKDYGVDDCFKDDKEAARSQMKGSIYGTLGFIIVVFVLALKQDKINLYIRLYNFFIECKIMRSYASTYIAVWGLKDQGKKEPYSAKLERKIVEAFSLYIYGFEHQDRDPIMKRAKEGTLYDSKKED